LNFFDELLKQKPKGTYRSSHIRAFVRSHFDQLSAIKGKGYSWKQIADTIQARLHIPSRNFKSSLSAAYYLEKRKRA